MVNYEQFKKEQIELAKKTAIQKKQLAGQRITTVIKKSNYKKAFTTPKDGARIKANTSRVITSLFGQTNQTRQTGKVGRPPGRYKNPAGVPAQVWYKIQRQQKRLATIQAEQIQAQRLKALAQRGISPQQVQQIEIQRQMQMQQTQQIQPQPQQVQQIPQAGRVMPTTNRPRIWRDNSYQDQDWTAFGVKTVERGTPRSFWN